MKSCFSGSVAKNIQPARMGIVLFSTFYLALGSVNSKSEIVPSTADQNLAVLAKFMTNSFLGNNEFKSCAELWHQDQRPESCSQFYQRVESFADDNAGGLTRALLRSMIEFYLGVDQITQENCLKLTKQNIKDCQEEQIKEIGILLQRFKDDVR